MQRPEQLLEVFDSLEAQNLALIQSMQEARAALEDAGQKQLAMKARLDTESGALQVQVRHLEQARDEQARLCASLKVTTYS